MRDTALLHNDAQPVHRTDTASELSAGAATGHRRRRPRPDGDRHRSYRRLVRALRAEALKLAGLPGAWVGSTLAVALPVALELFNTRGMAARLAADPDSHLHELLPDMGFMDAIFGVVGIVVLGAVSVAGEYTATAQSLGSARQVSTTLLVEPRRGVTAAAKVLVVLGTTALLAALACTLTFTVTTSALGEWSPSFWPVPWGRVAGLYGWWAVNALVAMGLASLTRGALVPLAWCLTTTSLVSPGFLLSKVTDLAAYLPDSAAFGLTMTSYDASVLPAGRAWAALTAWGLAALALTVVPWVRRDA